MIVYERFIIHFTDVIVALLLLLCVFILSASVTKSLCF